MKTFDRWIVARSLLVRVGVLLLAAAPAIALADQRAQIEAVSATVISSQLSGRIDKIGYREGETFDKGDVLTSIDCTSYIAERDRVRAKLGSARRKHENQEQLQRLQSAGKLEVDLSRLAVSETRAQLRGAQADVNRCDVRAPFDGRVAELYASLGESVKPQQKLLKIVGTELDARVIVPATWLSWLDEGAKVTLAVAENGARVSGKVVRIGAAVDPVSHTIPVWVDLGKAEALRPGMTARASFPGAPGQDDESNAKPTP